MDSEPLAPNPDAHLVQGRPGDPEIFKKLERRGVDYTQVMQIVEFSQPGYPFPFARYFGKRTIRDVLAWIASWKEFLASDFLLTPDQRAQVVEWIRQTETFVWAVVRDANFKIGDWTVRWYAIPPEALPDGELLMSATTVRAINEKTKETRTHLIPGRPRRAPRDFATEMEEVYTALGLRDQLWLESPFKLFMNYRPSKAWPVYTKIIPCLYDFLLPYYQSPGHHSDDKDKDAGPTPQAMYPKDLLEDMRTILKVHHPHFLADLTAEQIKAHIQRYIARKSKRRPNAGKR